MRTEPRPADGAAPVRPADGASPARPRLVLWDWNGTLLDDLTYAIGVRNRTFPAFGLPRIESVAEYRRQFTFPCAATMSAPGLTDENFEAVAHAWMAEYVRGFDAVPLHGDAREALSRFAAAGAAQAVLSATRRDMLESQIARFPSAIISPTCWAFRTSTRAARRPWAWRTWPAAACPPRPPS